LDRALVERARDGDELAFGRLVFTIGDRLYGVAFHMLRDATLADDAVQEALIQAWRELPRLRDPDRFEAWAIRITVRAAYAELGRRRRHGPTLIHVESRQDSTPDRSAVLADRDQLEHGFRRLSPEHRAVVVLKHYIGLPDDEIAAALDIPSGTVRSRLYHAIRSLRAALDADDRTSPDENRP